MKVEQFVRLADTSWSAGFPGALADLAQLVLVFGARRFLDDQGLMGQIETAYPAAHLLGCSTAGEIAGASVQDDSLVVTATVFENARLAAAEIDLAQAADSFDAGQRLAAGLETQGLVHAMVISDGLGVNGSELVRGLSNGLPARVGITGGLAADGERFQRTLVYTGGGAGERKAAVIGFYGQGLRIGYGSMGGWDAFGPDRLITRSNANVLYEMDGQSALDLYKLYLGEQAANLPACGLFFPLSVRKSRNDTGVVRAVLSVNEAERSMTFAGDMPVGSHARLMRANLERLIDGAQGAAQVARQGSAAAGEPELAILISCVARKVVLKQRVEEEVEAVRDVFGERAVLAGFYSYGEISPFTPSGKCELHNQTMTITTFSEN